MIREFKTLTPLLSKNLIYRVFVVLFFSLFFYFFYILYGNKANPFIFLSNVDLKTNDLLLLLSKNICPIFFYLFSILFVADISSEFFKKIDPIIKIRDKGVFKKLLTHFIITVLYSIITALTMTLFYNVVTSNLPNFHNLFFSILLITLSLFIVTTFGTISQDSMGYVFNILLLSIQPFITISIQTKILLLISIIVLLSLLNYFCYKYKENI
ncbi:hypothetical protein EFK22_13480 [Lactococcus lactis subsp. lactis]|nr:hypothetical protein [Lactococcus lactis subsp. lactis]MCT0454233.1 hypothetical protein [Lactococcus cremoris]MCT0036119.1 hypothetical protein [Lactococcus lactis subsp. lactis]MCT0059781.1 hypothetical protein [Lactococcus lactis subsp. lactis]MCT0062264.1 hypothetical protein [Lactococcus lactis subsp. lactis]